MYLFLIRGLPGSGKDTLAARLKGPGLAPSSIVRIHSADDFFMSHNQNWTKHPFETVGPRHRRRATPPTTYNFDPKKLPQAYKACQEDCDASLEDGYDVAICNTFSCRWELQPYLDLAKKHDATVIVMDLFDAGLTDEELAERNTHGVPVESIAAMRRRWESEWTMYSPLPPWER